MISRNNSLSCTEANEIDLVDFLSSIGHEPQKVRNYNYWYLSPLRNEKTASFKVDRKMNRWYDHGLGKGGTVVDFAIQYYDCTVGELLQRLSDRHFSFHQQRTLNRSSGEQQESQVHIIKETTLLSFSLGRYLFERRIPFAIADSYCKETTFSINNKTYFAIGFANDSGGYELRNPFFKGSSAPKDITTFRNGGNEVAVFEGFFDFLSYLSIKGNEPQMPEDFIVLNSLSFFEKARPTMEQYEAIRLFLDKDVTGQNCTHYATSLSRKYVDESNLYRGHKDLNDWVVNLGKKRLQQKI